MANGENSKYLEIDGGILEGGGQILRLAASFSALLKQPIKVFNIRAGRAQGGLRAQHLMGLKMTSDICDGELLDASLGSTSIKFTPGKIRSGNYSADTKTAGSVVLLLQVSLPCLLFSQSTSRLCLRGGTNAEMAPQIDYMTMVFKPIAQKMGVNFKVDSLVRGFFPKGGGELKMSIEPVRNALKPITLVDRGEVIRISGKSFVAGTFPPKLAHLMADEAANLIKSHYPNVHIDITRNKDSPQEAFGNGAGIVLYAETNTGCLIGSSAVSKPREDVRDTGRKAGQDLVVELDAAGCVDKHLQDQLIIFMALAEGTSSVRCGPLTLHTQTAIHMAKQMTKAEFTIEEEAKTTLITCKGIGLSNV